MDHMTMAGVAVEVRIPGMTVFMFMKMGGHSHHSTRSMKGAQPFPVLITHYDTLTPRID